MAYNKVNYYKKIIEIQELTYKLYHTKSMFYKEIYWQYIYPKYHISYRTYHNYLGVPAKRELKKLSPKEALNNEVIANSSHENKYIKAIETTLNCETTALFCLDCGKQLSKHKTDIR